MTSSDLLHEHRLALQKIDDAVARASSAAGNQLRCERGCSSCCVDGLTVLPVEAELIRASGLRPPARPMPGMCAFLDEEGACSVYQVRPVLCRTHGLALKTGEAGVRGSLRVLGQDVSACELNYSTRAPAREEILDATRLMMLLVTVDRRYRAHAGLEDDETRVSLRELSETLIAATS